MSQPVPAVLHRIHIHPVTSLTGCTSGSAAVEPWGLTGDKRWMPVDEDGSAVTQRRYPRPALAAAEHCPAAVVRLSAPGARDAAADGALLARRALSPLVAAAVHRKKVPFQWTSSGQILSRPARRPGPRTAAPENPRPPPRGQ
ncbi:MOSC N-terminal beta barrel domain-containing protein [Streptomyces sp. NBC_00455]|uniref:MOSC N-terminal beta barrel domain-containing protein n=1 Tax=Streptomyces sp. NBC_00455 TaxID=2903654 RepID=UPI003FCE02C5